MDALDKVINEYTCKISDGGYATLQIQYDKIIPMIKLGLINKDEFINRINDFNKEIFKNHFETQIKRHKLNSEFEPIISTLKGPI